jgi:c-di-GMP phosphodiesterase
MRLINHYYSDHEQLSSFIDTDIHSVQTIFIQIFSGTMDLLTIQLILDLLHTKLPQAIIIGATTAGEIMDGVMSSHEIVIAFSLFDATDITSYYFHHCDYDNGVRAAHEIVTERTKVCIVLSEGVNSDSESFLNGFTSVRSDVMLAGGNAGDDLKFSRTYIMKDDVIYDEGVVVVVLDSDVLQVYNAYSLNWTSVGKEMSITKVDKNIVYEIDNRPVLEVYKHYLGSEVFKQGTTNTIEFPLIKIKDGIRIARDVIAKTDDDAFIYAGHFSVGEKVRFAIGNVDEILDHAADVRDKIASSPVEATYIYSCSVRKLFFKEQLNYEFGLINDIAPTAGFFTFGEFFHSALGNQLLNITTTTLSLSENTVVSSGDSKHRDLIEHRNTMLKSLTHLVNVTQHELDDNIRFLDQYKMVLDESSVVSKTDARGVITYVNDAFCEVSGFSREELIGKNHNMVRHPDTPAELFKDLWGTIQSGKIWKETFKNLSKGGKTYHVKTVIAPIFDDEGIIVEYIAARVNVTELITKEQIIQRQLQDTLSGLKNRTALLNDLEEYENNDVSLVLINIDRFSNINDYFGYEVGDLLLKSFAERLRDTVLHDYVYRISGDEFAIICKDRIFNDELRDHVIEHLDKLENFKYSVAGYEHTLNVTCGVAHAIYSDVYNLAHMALKEAKEQRSKLIFFNDNTELSEKNRNNIWMISKLKSAIEEDRIVPYFQGILDHNSHKITKFEALIRLIVKDGTVLNPFWFLEHAKKSKLYDKLTQIMIKKTFATFEKNGYEFSLNLTLRDITNDETRSFLYETLEHSSASSRAVFEIVESEGIENFEEVAEFIKAVKAYGCKIAIDDFGTGYSNFSYLSKLDIDYIKIDGSLIKNITQDDDHLLTVESILFYSQRKKIQTIAEFVENKEIYLTLISLGVDFSQGFLFATPQPTIAG